MNSLTSLTLKQAKLLYDALGYLQDGRYIEKSEVQDIELLENKLRKIIKDNK